MPVAFAGTFAPGKWDRLLAHLRRWHGLSICKRYAVEWLGEPVGGVDKAFRNVVRDAGLGEDVTPHTLRHTAATWLMQGGTDLWIAAGFLGMSVETLERTYGHHHPDFQAQAAKNISARPGDRLGDRNPANKREHSPTNVTNVIDFSKGYAT